MKTKQEWLNQCERDRNKIESLIKYYHPHSGLKNNRPFVKLPVTAPSAESARLNVINAMRAEGSNSISPAEQFNMALKARNVTKLMSLMNGAWFGVPESTSCWQIEGFTEAVQLLEDPPEEPLCKLCDYPEDAHPVSKTSQSDNMIEDLICNKYVAQTEERE